MLAKRCLSAWNDPIGLPNCSRTLAYSSVVSKMTRHVPTHRQRHRRDGLAHRALDVDFARHAGHEHARPSLTSTPSKRTLASGIVGSSIVSGVRARRGRGRPRTRRRRRRPRSRRPLAPSNTWRAVPLQHAPVAHALGGHVGVDGERAGDRAARRPATASTVAAAFANHRSELRDRGDERRRRDHACQVPRPRDRSRRRSARARRRPRARRWPATRVRPASPTACRRRRCPRPRNTARTSDGGHAPASTERALSRSSS